MSPPSLCRSIHKQQPDPPEAERMQEHPLTVRQLVRAELLLRCCCCCRRRRPPGSTTRRSSSSRPAWPSTPVLAVGSGAGSRASLTDRVSVTEHARSLAPAGPRRIAPPPSRPTLAVPGVARSQGRRALPAACDACSGPSRSSCGARRYGGGGGGRTRTRACGCEHRGGDRQAADTAPTARPCALAVPGWRSGVRDGPGSPPVAEVRSLLPAPAQPTPRPLSHSTPPPPILLAVKQTTVLAAPALLPLLAPLAARGLLGSSSGIVRLSSMGPTR